MILRDIRIYFIKKTIQEEVTSCLFSVDMGTQKLDTSDYTSHKRQRLHFLK